MKIHFVLQGKGGVGKSFVSLMIAQYIKSKGQSPLCIDTDPVNDTFTGFNALDVKHVDIMKDKKIDSRKFDSVVQQIADSEVDVVVDTGSPNFISLTHYLISNSIAELLTSVGHELVIHTVIVGGQSQEHSVAGFAQIVSQFGSDSVKFVVWLNTIGGEIEHEGKGFEQFKAYKENKAKVSAIIQVPERSELHREDIKKMLTERKTFEEAIQNPDLNIVERQRLAQFRNELMDRINISGVF